jgi:hypothetical protein
MTRYVIERKVKDGGKGGWENAWGLKKRSYPTAETDEEAVAIFLRETARARIPHRLVRRDGHGYTVATTVLASWPKP